MVRRLKEKIGTQNRFVSLSEFLIVLIVVVLGVVGISLFGIAYTVLLCIAILGGYILVARVLDLIPPDPS
jgi:Flp pilus assembly protein TadB